MLRRVAIGSFVIATLLGSAGRADAQTFPANDPVLQRIWTIGMDSSRMYSLLQPLLDSIGPRLTGSPQQDAAVNWAIARFASWGIDGRKQQYDTARGWRRGPTHIDLIAPRVRTLDGTMLAWSVGTRGKNVDGEVVLPPLATEDMARWRKTIKGKFVLLGPAQPTCRPADDWKQWALPGSKPGRPDSVPARATIKSTDVEGDGVAGVIASPWTGGWGTNRIMGARSRIVPTIALSCEDFGLLYRLAEHHQGPRIRLNADAKDLGPVPVYNALGEIKGTTKAGEYVLLSAHLDSWDGGSGATDNGTGSAIVLEAARILKAAYPKPNRTIMFALWNGEEQGLNGSRGFVQKNKAMLDSIHVVFNRDGEGRPTGMSGAGFKAAESYFKAWLGKMPAEMTKDIKLELPGEPGGSTDHASFHEARVPAFGPTGSDWNYEMYSWHTNRDTFDKVSFDDLKRNATFLAMLVYLASEDATKMPRD